MSKYHQGIYKLRNPDKYEGDPTNVVYRSSWEFKVMRWCDQNSNILKWSSEETIIPYICATDSKTHMYFVDFKIRVKDKNGNIKTYLVEVKPKKQTIPPVKPKKNTKKYQEECLTFIKNQSKWKYAEEYCKDRGYQFMILTEDHLGI